MTDDIDLRDELLRHVDALASIGPRSVFDPESIRLAERYVEEAFRRAGFEPSRQTYRFDDWLDVSNIEVEIAGSARRDEIVVIGAHYDSVEISPGADDNASGVAALLAISKRLRAAKPERTLRFVAFVNEEPPHFRTEAMGSWRYAQRSKERGERIVAMLSLESIGYYSAAENSQAYPAPLGLLYPSRGDFVAFAGNLRSRRLVRRCVDAFRRHARIGAEGAAVPELIDPVGWSDQWSFWKIGVPALMVTDTAPFRNPHYHTAGDTADTLDYERMGRVVEGLVGVIAELGGTSRIEN